MPIFGDVTIMNRSRSQDVTLDLGLTITPREVSRRVPQAAIPTREDLTAISRRGWSAKAIFGNPVELTPRASLRRELVFVIRHAASGLSEHDHDFTLAVTDRLSGQGVASPCPRNIEARAA